MIRKVIQVCCDKCGRRLTFNSRSEVNACMLSERFGWLWTYPGMLDGQELHLCDKCRKKEQPSCSTT